MADTDAEDDESRLQALRDIVSSEPDDYFSRFCLGKEYLDQGRAGDAVPQLEACVRLNPDYPVAHRYLGQAFEKLSRIEDARRVWEQGMAVAERTALFQTGKEIQVFLSRLNRQDQK